MAKASEKADVKDSTSKQDQSVESPPTRLHGSSEWAKDQHEEDRVEKLIRESGCWDQHIMVVECMGEKQDWRKCQESLGDFKSCMTKTRKQQSKDPREASTTKK